MSDCVIGEAANLVLDVSSEAAYVDAGGNTVSSFALRPTENALKLAAHAFVCMLRYRYVNYNALTATDEFQALAAAVDAT
jgi:hypothetical protein